MLAEEGAGAGADASGAGAAASGAGAAAPTVAVKGFAPALGLGTAAITADIQTAATRTTKAIFFMSMMIDMCMRSVDGKALKRECVNRSHGCWIVFAFVGYSANAS